MRLFLGIELPQEIKDHIEHALTPIRPSTKGWELPHDYHMTLLFIGEATPEEAEDIISRMPKIKIAPFGIKLSTLEFFPRRILFQSFYPSEDLTLLKDKVENEFTEWVNPNAKPFKPHVTVKRYQRYEHEELKRNIELHPFEPKTFKVKELALFKCEKNSEGHRYHVIHRESLK